MRRESSVRSRGGKERAATCLPITITRIPVILHTRIIGCHSWSSSPSRFRIGVLEVWARTLRPKANASRFAWQVTRNLFACQRTRLSPLIPPSKLLQASKRFTYPPFTWSCFWCYHYRPASLNDLPKRIAQAIVILSSSRISIASIAWY